MSSYLYGLAHHNPELTHETLRAYLKAANWIEADTNQPTWYFAPTGDMADGAIWLPDSPHETPPGVGLADWPTIFDRAIETLATYEDQLVTEITVPYRVLQVLGRRRLSATDRQPGAFTTFCPYYTLLNLELPANLPAAESPRLRDILAHEAFRHWQLLQPETAAEWSLSWQAHIEVEYRGYAVWIEKVR
jgi:hypothetical protein